MYSDDNLIGIASYVYYEGSKIITEMARPVKSIQTDYYLNFLKYFKNQKESIKILASLDWLDDLFIRNQGGTFLKLIKNRKYFIYKNNLYTKEIKEGLKTITKTGHAIYQL